MIKSRLFKYHINGTLVVNFLFVGRKLTVRRLWFAWSWWFYCDVIFKHFSKRTQYCFIHFARNFFKFVFMANHKMQFYFCRPPVNGGNYNDNFERVEWSCSYFLWRLTFWYFRRIMRYGNNLSKINCLPTLHTRFLLGFRSIPSYVWHGASTLISDTRTLCIAGRNNALCDHAKDHETLIKCNGSQITDESAWCFRLDPLYPKDNNVLYKS